MRNKDDIQVSIVDVWPIEKEAGCNTIGIGIDWTSNIGWGQYYLYFSDDGKLHADTECIDSSEDKRFTQKILEALVNEIIVDG